MAAAASAAARATEEAPAQLPAFAREMERKQQRQAKELQYQAGTAAAEAPSQFARGRKSGAMIRVPAAPARNTRSATA